MLYKSVQGLQEVDDEAGTICGYFAKTGNIDAVGDIISPGAFKKTLRERGDRIRVLYNHDPMMMLGKPTVLKEDSKGLYYEFKIVPTTYGNDIMQLVKAGVIDAGSIGYAIPKGKAEMVQIDNRQARKLTELVLFEGSLVGFPANESALVTGLKSTNSIDVIEELKTKIDKLSAVLNKGNIDTADIIYSLEIWLEQLKDLLVSLEELQPEPEITPDEAEPKTESIDKSKEFLTTLLMKLKGN